MAGFLPALFAGVLLGGGLALSDMINPARVLAFLDVAGAWDPTLVFVMGAAVVAAAAGYAVSRRMKHPFFGTRFYIPENRVLEKRLLLGSALFGMGWGLVGICPGPAVAALAFGLWEPWVFFAAMLAGMLLHRLATSARVQAPARAPLLDSDA